LSLISKGMLYSLPPFLTSLMFVVAANIKILIILRQEGN